MAVGQVARHLGDVADLVGACGLDDLGHDLVGRDAVRQLGDDDRLHATRQRLGVEARLQTGRALALGVGLGQRGRIDEDAAGRKVRAGHDRQDVFERRVRVLGQHDRGGARLSEIVRRNLARHRPADATRAINEQVREGDGQHPRLLLLLREVRLVLGHDLGAQIGEPGRRGGGEAGLRIAVGGRRIRVLLRANAAPVALAIDERHVEHEALRHADHRVVNRRVAMRVVVADHMTNRQGRLLIRPTRAATELVHRMDDAALDGL